MAANAALTVYVDLGTIKTQHLIDALKKRETTPEDPSLTVDVEARAVIAHDAEVDELVGAIKRFIPEDDLYETFGLEHPRDVEISSFEDKE